jgi:tetratricopeptide (TPR) repeat protein
MDRAISLLQGPLCRSPTSLPTPRPPLVAFPPGPASPPGWLLPLLGPRGGRLRPGTRGGLPDALCFLLLLAAALAVGPAVGHAQAPPQDPSGVEAAQAAVAALEARDAGPAELGRAQHALATAYMAQGRAGEALVPARQAVLRLEEAGGLSPDDAGLQDEVAAAWNQEGLALWSLARYESAVQALHQAREIWTRLDDRSALGRVYNNLGTAHYQWGNYELALEAYLRAYDFREETGDLPGQARVLANMGLVYQDWYQLEEAREALEGAVRLADATDDGALRGYAWQTLGNLLLTLREVDAAEAAFERAESLYPAGTLAFSAAGRAMVRMARGDHGGALQLLESFLVQARAQGLPRHEARALLHMGQVHRDAGELGAAARALEAGLQVAETWELRPLAVTLLAELAQVREGQGDAGAALATLRRHHALRDSIFSQSTGQRVAAMEARLEAERRERENEELRATRMEQETRLARQRLTFLLGGALLLALTGLVAVLVRFNRKGREREALLADSNRALASTNRELRTALSEVRVLKGLIPICAQCKKVRDDQGYWEAVETYITERSEAFFSHSICADCGPRVYGPDWDETAPEGRGRITGRNPGEASEGALVPSSPPEADERD